MSAGTGVAVLAALLGLALPVPSEGIGTCREVNCGQSTTPTPTPTQTPEPQAPKESKWRECRTRDTFPGCCKNYYHGKYTASGPSGVAMCCWDNTPDDPARGSTTAIEVKGGNDVYAPDASGRSCRSQGVR